MSPVGRRYDLDECTNMRSPSGIREALMTGPEHYRRAEQLVESVTRRGKGELEDEAMVSNDHPGLIAAAQVHAVLALTAATALDSDRREWFNVAGSKLSD
jgi:hypothetical protein